MKPRNMPTDLTQISICISFDSDQKFMDLFEPSKMYVRNCKM